MELGAAVAVCVAAVVVVILAHQGGDPSRTIAGMWRYSAPDWPHGVQEDDDAHWSWTPPSAGGEADDDWAGRLPAMDTGLLPLRYEVRSADRARS